MEILHPPGWELAVASGVDESRRCTFADRLYHRLDVRWQELDFMPNLSLVLDKYRRRTQAETRKFKELGSAPAGWQGLVQTTMEGSQVVHAVRFFKPERLMAEVALVWPEKRDHGLEAEILAGLRPEGKARSERLWRAMGMSLSLARRFELRTSKAPVGKVEWTFTTGRKNDVELTVRRIAMPKYWLNGALRDWLADQPPSQNRQIRQDHVRFNAHRAERLFSCGRITPLASLLGRRQYRMDLAWLCPIEDRVYHVTCCQPRRDEDISVPPSLVIRCCRRIRGICPEAGP